VKNEEFLCDANKPCRATAFDVDRAAMEKQSELPDDRKKDSDQGGLLLLPTKPLSNSR